MQHQGRTLTFQHFETLFKIGMGERGIHILY